MSKSKTFKEANPSFKVDEGLKSLFKVVGIDDINDAESGKRTKEVRSILSTLEIDRWEMAYRVVSLNAGLLKVEPAKLSHLSDVIAVCNFAMKNAHVPINFDQLTMDQLVQGSIIGSSGSDRPTRPGDLCSFTGKDHDWPLVKEKWEAQFKIDGLWKVIVDEEYARFHPRLNCTVHGMLTKALLSKGPYSHFPCLIEDKGDGHAAWRRICDFYEHHLLLNNSLQMFQKQLEDLTLRKVEDFQTFVAEFMWLREHMTSTARLGKERDVSLAHMVDKINWKLRFLDKCTPPLLQSKVETCRITPSIDLWECVLEMKGVILHHKSGMSVGGGGRKRGNENGEDGGGAESQMVRMALADQGKLLQLLQGIMSKQEGAAQDSKPNSQDNGSSEAQSGNGGKRKNKRKRQYKGRRNQLGSGGQIDGHYGGGNTNSGDDDDDENVMDMDLASVSFF